MSSSVLFFGCSLVKLSRLILSSIILFFSLSDAVSKRSQQKSWRLAKHSFQRTLSPDHNLDNWHLSAGSMALRDRLQLFPPVAKRYGIAWHKDPILTRDFEVRFSISASNEKGEGDWPQDSILTFWVNKQDFAKSFNEREILKSGRGDWKVGLESAGLDLHGHSKSFQGLAVTLDGRGGKQRVTGYPSGMNPATVDDITGSGRGSVSKDVQWISAGAQFSVRVYPDGSATGKMMRLDAHKHFVGNVWGWAADGVNARHNITFLPDGKVTWDDGEPHGSWKLLPGHKLALSVVNQDSVLRIEGSNLAVVEEPQVEPRPALFYGGVTPKDDASDWETIFTFPPGTLKSKLLWLGFSGFSGSTSYVEANLHRFEVVNFDPRVPGESTDPGVVNEEWLKELENEKRFLDQASQADAIVRLKRLLDNHIEHCDNLGGKIRTGLVSMESHLDMIGSGMSNYVAATKAFSFDTDTFEPKALQGQLQGLRQTLSQRQEMHKSKVEVLNQATKAFTAEQMGQTREQVKRVSDQVERAMSQTRDVEEFVARSSFLNNVMYFVMVASIIGLGLLFLKRMKYYEKRHYI